MLLFSWKTCLRATQLSKPLRLFSTSPKDNYKVTLLGGAGGIGRNVALNLKLNPRVTQLALQDVSPYVHELTADIADINTGTKVSGFSADDTEMALNGASIVVILASRPYPPNIKKRSELFPLNADIIFDLTNRIAEYCPNAVIALVTNPINSGVHVISEVMKKHGAYDPCKIFGVTTIDVIRANAIVAQLNGSDPVTQCVPVVGGHDEDCIVPLLSQCQPPLLNIKEDKLMALYNRISKAGNEVLSSKDNQPATLSKALATSHFVDAILRGFCSEKDIIECAYVKSDITEAQYFSNPLQLGINGIETNLGFGKVTEYEQCLINQAVTIIQNDIQQAEDYMKKKVVEIHT